jgi:hypothetical protein
MKAAALTLALLVLAGAAAAATNAERVIGRKTTSGDFAVAAASGSALKPVAIRVRVVSTPAQPVQVSWKTVCKKGARSATKRGGYRATTPVVRPVVFAMLKPDRCSVSASAQLEQQGMVTVTLLAR